MWLGAVPALILALAGGGTGQAAIAMTPVAAGRNAPVRRVPLAATGKTPVHGGFFYVPAEASDRILEVDSRGRVVWQATVADPDDVSVTPHGNLVVNEPDRSVVVEISRRTGRVIWHYGHAGVAGSAPGYLRLPDDAFRLPGGDTLICDSGNARVIAVDRAGRIVWQYGHTGVWGTAAGYLAAPNDAVPLPGRRVLITTQFPPRVLEVAWGGRVLWSLAADRQFAVRPVVAELSDAVPVAPGRYVVAVYANPGRILEFGASGHVYWTYGPDAGLGALDHPSAVFPLVGGRFAISDDGHQRVLVVDRAGRVLWVFGGPTQTPGVSDVKPAEPWPTFTPAWGWGAPRPAA